MILQNYCSCIDVGVPVTSWLALVFFFHMAAQQFIANRLGRLCFSNKTFKEIYQFVLYFD